MRIQAISSDPYFDLRGYNEFEVANRGARGAASKSFSTSLKHRNPVLPPMKMIPDGVSVLDMGSLQSKGLIQVTPFYQAFHDRYKHLAISQDFEKRWISRRVNESFVLQKKDEQAHFKKVDAYVDNLSAQRYADLGRAEQMSNQLREVTAQMHELANARYGDSDQELHSLQDSIKASNPTKALRSFETHAVTVPETAATMSIVQMNAAAPMVAQVMTQQQMMLAQAAYQRGGDQAVSSVEAASAIAKA